jgi:hypothetical protein
MSRIYSRRFSNMRSLQHSRRSCWRACSCSRRTVSEMWRGWWTVSCSILPPVLIANQSGRARFLRTSNKKEPVRLAHLVMIRNVLVTPTRLLIGPPQPEPSNSVTRRYGKQLEGIARVTFTDEEDRLFVSSQHSNSADMRRRTKQAKSTT